MLCALTHVTTNITLRVYKYLQIARLSFLPSPFQLSTNSKFLHSLSTSCLPDSDPDMPQYSMPLHPNAPRNTAPNLPQQKLKHCLRALQVMRSKRLKHKHQHHPRSLRVLISSHTKRLKHKHQHHPRPLRATRSAYTKRLKHKNRKRDHRPIASLGLMNHVPISRNFLPITLNFRTATKE